MRSDHAAAEARDLIEEAAAEFLERRRFGPWNAADREALDAWLAESEARRVAFWRLEAGLSRVERLAALRAPAPKPKRQRRWMPLRFAVPILATAASLSLAAILGLAAERYFFRISDKTYATGVGGHAILRFSDKTEIELDTDTLVRYRMTNRERTVWLEKGEAWFHVSHDPGNPFAVIVGHHRVDDLGTDFAVRRSADEVEVALLKGRASLSSENAQTAMLSPGDDAVATTSSLSVTRRTPQELEDALAWRKGMLVFRNARLADAVREFNRYNRTKIVIRDPTIADLKFSVSIRDDNFEGFLQLAETILDLRAAPDGQNVLLYREAAKTKRTKAAGVR